MFNSDYEAPKKKTVPTLKQYIKTLSAKSKALQQTFQVEIIWLPGQFDNVTLQTHAFRLIFDDNHPLYAAIQERYGRDTFDKGSPAFGIKITDRETQSFTLEEQPDKKGQWKTLGKNAIKFEGVH